MDSKRFDGIYPDQWIASGRNIYFEIYIAAHDKENFNAITIPLSNAEVKELVQHLTKLLEENNER